MTKRLGSNFARLVEKHFKVKVAIVTDRIRFLNRALVFSIRPNGSTTAFYDGVQSSSRFAIWTEVWALQ